MNFMKYLIFFIFINVSSLAMNSRLNNLSIISKSNGIILQMELDELLKSNRINAWQANSGWFYLTIYELSGDSNQLKPDYIPSEIQKLQIIENQQSLQIGIKINQPIQYYDFIYNNENSSIIANLYYSTDYFAKIDKVIQKNHLDIHKDTRRNTNNWLYKSGVFITLLGYLNNQNKLNNNTSQLGIGILISTFLFDTLIRNYFTTQ